MVYVRFIFREWNTPTLTFFERTVVVVCICDLSGLLLKGSHALGVFFFFFFDVESMHPMYTSELALDIYKPDNHVTIITSTFLSDRAQAHPSPAPLLIW